MAKKAIMPTSTLFAVWNAALIAIGFFVCSLVKPPLSSAPTEPIFLEDCPKATLEDVSAVFHDEVQKGTCGIEIDRLKTVLNELEAKHGFDELRKGVRLGGLKWRTTLLVQKLLSGAPLKVAMVGGSVSYGRFLDPNFGDKTFGEHLIDSLSSLFPPQNGGTHKLMTSAIGGIGSYVHHYCAFDIMRERHCTKFEPKSITQDTLTSSSASDGDDDVSSVGKEDKRECDAVSDAKKADLVLLDFAANDYVLMQPEDRPDTRQAEDDVLRHQESVLRQMLALPSGALTLFVNFGFASLTIPRMECVSLTSQHLVHRLGSHYGTPSVSLLDAFGPNLTVSDPIPNCKDRCYRNKWLWDDIHLTSLGHRLAADLILYLLLTDVTSVLQSWEASSQKVKRESHPDNSPTNVRGGESSSSSGRRLLNERGGLEHKENGSGGEGGEGVLRRNLGEGSSVVEECVARGVSIKRSEMPEPIHPRNKDTNPSCWMARDWNLTKVFGQWQFEEHRFMTDKNSKTLTTKVDFGNFKSFGVLYKRSHRYEEVNNVLNVTIGGLQVAELRMYWQMSHFYVWYLVEDVYESESFLGLQDLTISSAGVNNEIMAFVAE